VLSTEKGGDSVRKLRKLTACLFASATLFAVVATPAAAQEQGDALVNVNISDVHILEDVNVAVAANIVAAVCAQDITIPVALLAVQGVDASGDEFFCEARGGRPDLTITQNT
jgi:hypothetical protein